MQKLKVFFLEQLKNSVLLRSTDLRRSELGRQTLRMYVAYEDHVMNKHEQLSCVIPV